MSTMNMKPDTLLILAAVGIGAWWMLSRQARAQTVPGTRFGSLLPGSSGATMYQAPVPQRDPRDPVLNAIGSRLGDWLGTKPRAPAIVGPDLTAVNPGPGQWATDEYGNGLF